ncbi:MAG: bifunctional 5,10-methylenetetrahydrofolate dehydrogenase/5,10-methenyltetrahydrofolate cyclohydrolase [Candidatus Sungbacteria bacterium]|uniref:Bifunctional protein FolD n=1 Tax=Candidatus Sungiibacteriota bacterium TaxID=2750080 RepID=A0A932VR16_9BACT|nr:bifunctional 5,10-methylenetetrahydrofolate dehydrogenase/5,10-methenyltetrahydrofolate cyclohydrolase [Candidatus Sungbacteria bacterium]
MILLDGAKIARKVYADLKTEIAALPAKPRLAVVVVGKDPVVESFITQKKKAAESIGVEVRVYPFPETITTNELRRRIAVIVHEKKNMGVIIQLPLPPHINKHYILNAIPPEKDPDVLSGRAIGNFAVGKSSIMPPVAQAIKLLFENYGVDYKNKHVLLLGAGSLVGRPVALWLLSEHASFSVVGSPEHDPEPFFQSAEIVIAGIGRPGFVTGKMVRQGTVVVDAGTSESAGRVVGDVDVRSVSPKASYLARVPGGVGPVTVASLLKNLLILAKR